MTKLLILITSLVAAQSVLAQTPPADAPTAQEEREVSGVRVPLQQLWPGDSVSIQVYGQPDMNGTVSVSDNGYLPVSLAGPVQVGGLSTADAAGRIEQALREGKFLVDPHVTLTIVESRSRRISVLGQVNKPGRYATESNTSIFDLLAEAGGLAENGGDIVYILRPGKDGKITRHRVSLKALSEGTQVSSEPLLNAGDSVFVPLATQFYIYGEIAAPGKFKVEPGMTILQAIARAGGVTQRGSTHRIEVKRAKPDGTYDTRKAKLSDLVQADDVIRVKESIF